MHGLGLGVLLPFQGPLDGANPTYLLLELSLGMPIRLENRFGSFAHIMELTELMRHAWQAPDDGLANGLLAVRNHADDRHRQRFFDLAEQGEEVSLRTAEEGARQEHLS